MHSKVRSNPSSNFTIMNVAPGRLWQCILSAPIKDRDSLRGIAPAVLLDFRWPVVEQKRSSLLARVTPVVKFLPCSFFPRAHLDYRSALPRDLPRPPATAWSTLPAHLHCFPGRFYCFSGRFHCFPGHFHCFPEHLQPLPWHLHFSPRHSDRDPYGPFPDGVLKPGNIKSGGWFERSTASPCGECWCTVPFCATHCFQFPGHSSPDQPLPGSPGRKLCTRIPPPWTSRCPGDWAVCTAHIPELLRRSQSPSCEPSGSCPHHISGHSSDLPGNFTAE